MKASCLAVVPAQAKGITATRLTLADEYVLSLQVPVQDVFAVYMPYAQCNLDKPA